MVTSIEYTSWSSSGSVAGDPASSSVSMYTSSSVGVIPGEVHVEVVEVIRCVQGRLRIDILCVHIDVAAIRIPVQVVARRLERDQAAGAGAAEVHVDVLVGTRLDGHELIGGKAPVRVDVARCGVGVLRRQRLVG